MEFHLVKSTAEINRFISFSGDVYQGNPYYRDGMSAIVRIFLTRQTVYLQQGDIFPFLILDGQQIILRGAYILNRGLPEILMLAFFEAKPNAQRAVDLMLAEGKKLAAEHGRKKIVIGLDGHINYGVGLLASHFDQAPCFGFPYTPDYYLDYFQGLTEYSFTSFVTEISSFHLEGEGRIIHRLNRHGYSFRIADFQHFQRELEIYTDLNNACFQDHLWWFNRTYQEDYELLHPFRSFISGENLIIAEKNGRAIGFMLWYPDFNQLIPPGRGIGLTTLIKNKLGGSRKIDRIKIAEVAVRQEFQGSGLVVGLFAKLHELVRDRYRYCEAGWVEESNFRSKGLGLHWEQAGCLEFKKYKAFELSL